MEILIISCTLFVFFCIAYIVYGKEIREFENKLFHPKRKIAPIEANADIKRAEIVLKRIRGSADSKNKTLEYLITFRTEDGDTIKYSVDKKLFKYVRERQQGLLITVNGQFVEFCEEKELSKEEIKS